MDNIIIGVDEAGRGQLFGSVYTGAATFYYSSNIDKSCLKDSKKYTKKSLLKTYNYINNNIKFRNSNSNNSKFVKSSQDPRLQAEGKAGQSTEIGVIFISSSNFESEPGSEWIIGTCVKSPCVAAGNNELTSVYR